MVNYWAIAIGINQYQLFQLRGNPEDVLAQVAVLAQEESAQKAVNNLKSPSRAA